MIPLTMALQEGGHKVFIAAPQSALNLFENPDIVKIEFGSYRVRYPGLMPLFPALVIQSPIMFIQAIIDRLRIGKIIRENSITTLISDNRFGCRSRRVRSIYVTHQVNIASVVDPARRSRLLSALHRMIINRYDECWIPDNPSPDNNAGFLSDPGHLTCKWRYIGLLSHISLATSSPPEGFIVGKFLLLILSGPEPAKGKFGERVGQLFKGSGSRLIVAGGSVSDESSQKSGDNRGSVIYTGQLGAANLRYLIENCEGVICRSGYSTIMDLISLGRGALLVPTPGQPEQLYLAEYLSSRDQFNSVAQKDLTLETIIRLSVIEEHNKNKGDKPYQKTGIDLTGRVDL
jgi:hypothetical protein